MEVLETKIITRLDQVISKGLESSQRGVQSFQNTFWTNDSAFFNEWKNNAENIILMTVGIESHYYKNFVAQVKSTYVDDINKGIGILKGLKEDVELGLLTSTKEIIIAELFTDFIEMSKHLLETGYKDPAASLTGAVLEDGLRKIAVKHDIVVKDSDDIAALNTKIADKEIYNRLKQKQIQAWKGLRDSADHGKFDAYKKEDIQDMLGGVERFLSEYL